MQQTEWQSLGATATRARLFALNAVHCSASGHIGGSLSAMDILTTLYFRVMNVDVSKPRDPDRDRFVLSKGHCTPALYSVLALKGFFPTDDLKLFRCIRGNLSGHAEMNHVTGVDMSTGSLGQGLSAAVGMALAGKIDHKDYRVYALTGDGELDEGQIWEALMSASKYKLDNLCITVDRNGLQIDGKTSDVMPLEPLDKKFESFGCHVLTVDGHDYASLEEAYARAATLKGAPMVILAKTIKGKGVSFMENDAGWHGKAPNDEQYEKAWAELEATLRGWEEA